MSVVDAPHRAEALDVGRSFCVTAPAGSGKTELLIQRYLALLSRVQRPEQVLAITFTRKAAAEMRERVLEALHHALADIPCEGEHQQITRDLARAALSRGEEAGWHLTRDVSRLNIKTIDSFCAGITRQMPVLSGFGGQAQAVDDAQPLYREAVAELFTLLDGDRNEASDLRSLMLHFDNNWERLSELLTTMLAKRDQWHEYMGARRSASEAEARLQHTVTSLIEESLAELSAALAPWEDELLELLGYALGNLGSPVPDSFPTPRVAQLGLWRALANLFLTQKGELRKSITVREGFPTGKGEEQEYKQRWKDLVEGIAGVPGLTEELAALAWLPDMDDHSEAWQLVLHLSHVLPLLSAFLLLVFERRGSVDHTQVALSALDALGDEEAPTELALRLDYSIEHILVDEFQDTAINQYTLVSRLTRGWAQHNALNPEAPRTIFIVGDGMQSIYGFRNANVGLFLKAREEGFNGVVPESLALSANFRSEEGVVSWVNHTFRAAFPAQDNVRRGRVSYTDAVAVQKAGDEPAVSMNAFCGEDGPQQEAHWLVQQLRAGLEDERLGSIALLGRSRAQLTPILRLLRAEGIAFAAQDMDPLSSSPAIVDLLTLCRALANPADSVAWFALLRGPWMGLTLADLQRFGSFSPSPPGADLRSRILSGDLPDGLSAHALEGLDRLAACLVWLEQRRDRLALRVWLEQGWLQLGGPESLTASRYLRDAQRFMQLLEEAEQADVGLDIQWLEQRLQRLFAAGDDPESRIQVMTLHKAKGLEFDWVLIPALARTTRGDARDILLWDEYNSPDGERGFLLAADDHSDEKSPTLYNFLKRRRKEKSRLESTRLLYVGATRAIRHLTLSASLAIEGEVVNGEPVVLKDPAPASLLYPIWPEFRRSMTLHRPEPELEQAESPRAILRRVCLKVAPMPRPAETDTPGGNRPERAVNRLERFIGTVIHEQLDALSRLPTLPQHIEPGMTDAIRIRLCELGLWGAELERAEAGVRGALAQTLGDDVGRWVLSPDHPQSHSELPLTVARAGEVKDIVIDRTFLDQRTGLRWVIDYKSSAPTPGMAQATFMVEEALRYREQLETYRDAVRSLGSEPVRCALYFTSLGLLHPLSELDL